MTTHDPRVNSPSGGQIPPLAAPPQIHQYLAAQSIGAGRSSSRRKVLTAGFAVVSVLCFLLILAVVGITGYFRLSSPAAALRSSVMSAVPGPWDKTVALRVGWFTTGLIRTGSRFFDMPPEARAALDALHGGEVGVYKLRQDPVRTDLNTLFSTADEAMKRAGWDRVVGVAQDQQYVAVYFPQRKLSLRSVKCCVVVFQGRDLVVASASGNLEPLLKIAETHVDMGELRRCLPKGI